MANSDSKHDDAEKSLAVPPTQGPRKVFLFVVFVCLQVGLLSVLCLFLNPSRKLPKLKVIRIWSGHASKASTERSREEETGNATMGWQSLSDKMSKLNRNPVYAKFGIPRMKMRPKVNLLLIVSSAPKRLERRMAIRGTWWNQSSSNDKVIFCLLRFFFFYTVHNF